MASTVRSRCKLSAENCSFDDNKKEEAEKEEEEAVAAPKLSVIVGLRHMQGDTGGPAVPTLGTLVPLISASKKLLQRPSHPPPPPPCPSGDNVEEDIAAGEGQFMTPSAAQMTELHLRLQQQQQHQQPRCRYRPGQRSPGRQTSKSQQLLKPKDNDKKYEDEKAAVDDAAAAVDDAAPAAAEKTVLSSSEIPTDNVRQDAVAGPEQTADVDPQKLREKEDAAETKSDDVVVSTAAAAAAADDDDSSSKHADDCTHRTDFQMEVIFPTISNDELERWSSSGQWMKRPCGVIAEEASLDELLEKTGKLEHELRRQLDLKKQKMLDNARKEERIGLLEKTNSELKTKLTATDFELTKKDIKIAVIEEKNENLAKRLKFTQDVLAKLENDYERVVEEKLEFKSMYIDSRLKASETIGDLMDEINRQIEAKRSFIRIAQQIIPARSANGLKKALATTSEYLHLKCERNRLLDQVQHLKTRVEAQDLYIDDLSSAVKELSRIIQHYKVSLPTTEEEDEEVVQEEHENQEEEESENEQEEEEDDHSSTGRCATMTDESSGEVSPTSESSTKNSPEEEEEIEDQPNQDDDDLEQELEDICDETSDSDCRTETTEDSSTVLEFITPISSPSSSTKSQASRQDDDDDDEVGEE